MRVIEIRFLPPGATAVCVYPFGVFCKPGWMTPFNKTHELVHWKHQRDWCLYGLGVGLLLWFLLYLLILPIGWNPLRAFTERRAFRAQGVSHDEIDRKLRGRPYYLFF